MKYLSEMWRKQFLILIHLFNKKQNSFKSSTLHSYYHIHIRSSGFNDECSLRHKMYSSHWEWLLASSWGRCSSHTSSRWSSTWPAPRSPCQGRSPGSAAPRTSGCDDLRCTARSQLHYTRCCTDRSRKQRHLDLSSVLSRNNKFTGAVPPQNPRDPSECWTPRMLAGILYLATGAFFSFLASVSPPPTFPFFFLVTGGSVQ